MPVSTRSESCTGVGNVAVCAISLYLMPRVFFAKIAARAMSDRNHYNPARPAALKTFPAGQIAETIATQRALCPVEFVVGVQLDLLLQEITSVRNFKERKLSAGCTKVLTPSCDQDRL